LRKHREKNRKPKTDKFILFVQDGQGKTLLSKQFKTQRDICNEINLKPYQVCRIYKGQLNHPFYKIYKLDYLNATLKN
jgi:hypothetical protein